MDLGPERLHSSVQIKTEDSNRVKNEEEGESVDVKIEKVDEYEEQVEDNVLKEEEEMKVEIKEEEDLSWREDTEVTRDHQPPTRNASVALEASGSFCDAVAGRLPLGQLHPDPPAVLDSDEESISMYYDETESSSDGEFDSLSEKEFSDSDVPQPSISSREKKKFYGKNEAHTTRVQGNFQWMEGSDFVPPVIDFEQTPVGITSDFSLPEKPDECDYFLAYFDDDLVDHMVAETNRYFALCKEEEEVTPPQAHQKSWYDVTRSELLTFIALTWLMPFNNEEVVSKYWNRNNMLFMEVFPTYFTKNRYKNILNFLHFANSEEPHDADSLWEIRPVLNSLVDKFKKFFKPSQKVKINESQALFEEEIKLKHYVPSWDHHFELKLFVLCDCETGIVLDSCIFSGNEINIPKEDPLGLSGAVVKCLMENYLDRGHILYTSEWYTSPRLARFLTDRGTGIVGRIRRTRKFTPKFERTKRGDLRKYTADGMLIIQWHGMEKVYLLSTIHTGQMEETNKTHCRTGEKLVKPDAVIDYKENMTLRDKFDMPIINVNCFRKLDWGIKVVFHLIDICLLNAYNMYKFRTSRRPHFYNFRNTVVAQLLERYGERLPIHSQPGQENQRSDEAFPIHLHYPDVPLPLGGTGQKKLRECFVCKNTTKRPKKRKLATCICKECNVGLCIGDCFRDYHTLKSSQL